MTQKLLFNYIRLNSIIYISFSWCKYRQTHSTMQYIVLYKTIYLTLLNYKCK